MRRWAFLGVLLALPIVHAHSGYVVSRAAHGRDFAFLLLAAREYAGLILATMLLAVGAYALLSRQPFLRRHARAIERKRAEYAQFLPWIARLGLGIALIGAGSQQALVSPLEPASAWISGLEVFLGFFLLAGFLTGISALLATLLFLLAITQNWYLLGNLDFLALAFALLVLGSSKPGIDDLLGVPFLVQARRSAELVPLILRCGIGLSLVFLALYEKLLNPHLSGLVVHEFGLQAAIPVSAGMWVLSAGMVELAVGLALLLGWKTRSFAGVAFFVLSASFFLFSEAIYSHITLFATLSILFVTGGGKWSLDALRRSRPKRF